jgi:hypothetical protein
MHETEFHWPDAPATAEILNDGAVEELTNAALDVLRLQGRWPVDAA